MASVKNPASLNSPISVVKGVGPKIAALLARKGIRTIEDALYFIPRDYEDRSRVCRITDLTPDNPSTFAGQIVASRQVGAGRHRRAEVTVGDGAGKATCVWFHAPHHFSNQFTPGAWYLFFGKGSYFRGGISFLHPEFEKVEAPEPHLIAQSTHFGRMIPIYSETEGLNTKAIRKIVLAALKLALPEVTDPLPLPLRQKLGLPSLRDSFVRIHYPDAKAKEEERKAAIQRMAFEEFFVLQLGLGIRRGRKQWEKAPVLTPESRVLERFVAGLPFPLTGDQKQVMATLCADLARPFPMTRLLQGDVGAGKTVVALAGAAVAAQVKRQTVLMAPTEILAIQHFQSARKFLEPLGFTVVCLAHGAIDRDQLLARINSGAVDVVVGTHAVFQADVRFRNLGLVVVDEQHRFGVEQRNLLLKKNAGLIPHLLMMTATPIPRTLALTIYGDLDVSILREKPAGRKAVRTTIMRESERPRLYQKIRERVQRGEQVYLIYPLVEESEKLDLKNATDMYQQLSREVFPTFKLRLLHGRLKSEEKEAILTEFKSGKSQVLISTTVIEVGIDVANATLMVIEHPERLGLSQLHQLRGRVGRGELSSECILLAGKGVGERLRVMEKTEDGFEIAEEDLRIRGPGEFLGLRQSGLPGFRVGHFLRDADLLSLARVESDQILEKDAGLNLPEHSAIRQMVESRWKEKIERLRGA